MARITVKDVPNAMMYYVLDLDKGEKVEDVFAIDEEAGYIEVYDIEGWRKGPWLTNASLKRINGNFKLKERE